VAARGDAAARLKDKDTLFGGHVSPDDAYLCLRGLRTLSLRIERSGASVSPSPASLRAPQGRAGAAPRT
jgi:cystathionine beta-lyase/cystathionine gamma-synthase